MRIARKPLDWAYKTAHREYIYVALQKVDSASWTKIMTTAANVTFIFFTINLHG